MLKITKEITDGLKWVNFFDTHGLFINLSVNLLMIELLQYQKLPVNVFWTDGFCP